MTTNKRALAGLTDKELNEAEKRGSPDDKVNTTRMAIDWLTVTSKRRDGGSALLAVFDRYKDGPVKDVRFFGFDCLRDENGLTWGQRSIDGRYIFIASGQIAAEVWRMVVPWATKVTRIDLAVDVWLDTPRDQIKQSARLVLSPALETRLKYTYITGTKGVKRQRAGDTLYVGSRQSAQFGRFYDKGLQQGTAQPGKWLRYEVEYKSASAVQMAKAAIAQREAALGELISCTVHDWFLRRDVVPVFSPNSDTPGLVVRSQMQQTTKERKLAWLNSQVRPTIQYLFEQGLRSETLRALDIEFVQLSSRE